MSKGETKEEGVDARLRKLWDERRPAGLSQDAFGDEYKIGTQGMVSQYLKGRRPLNLEAVVKFAKGLNCTVADIDPKLAGWIREDVLPVLGMGQKQAPKPTDRSQERLTTDERDLLQIYRKLREIGREQLLLELAEKVHDDAMRGRTGAEVIPLTRGRSRKHR